MAYTANIVTEAEMQFMAGENVDATGDITANHEALQDQAEAYLSNLLQHNLGGTGFSGLDATLRILITEWAARYAGMSLILFNMQGYGTAESAARIHGEDMVNVHIFRMRAIEKLLLQKSVQDFMAT